MINRILPTAWYVWATKNLTLNGTIKGADILYLVSGDAMPRNKKKAKIFVWLCLYVHLVSDAVQTIIDSS